MEIYMDELTSQFPYEIGVDFKYIETIDHGAFGTVIHVIEISSNKDMAIKVINKSSSRSSIIKRVKDEIAILKKLNHENIVKFFGYFETNNQLLIKMEYVKYGTLSKWIKNHKKITEEEASIILRQIFSAVVYLHSKQICHRDIKPENIMLSRENDLKSIKIIDFGLSAQNFDKLMNSDYCGTYIYMAPEQIEKKLYFISVDIWSIGILMFMLLNNGKHPFYIKGESRKSFNKKVEKCKINFYNKVSPMAKHLIFKLLEPNPSWRYNAAQAYKHPWITRNKNDEIPLTFNELLNKSNMIKAGRNLFGVVLFLNFLTKKKKYFINDKYVKICNFYDEKSKKKIIKQRETCLDILSTSEGDESDSEIEKEKKIYLKNSENNNKNKFLFTNVQSSSIVSTNQIKQNNNTNRNTIKKKKLSFAKSTKMIGNFDKVLNNTDKKTSINIKKIDYKFNLLANKKPKLENNHKNKKKNIVKEHLVKISINSFNNNKTKGTTFRNSKKLFDKEYRVSNHSMSIRVMRDSKKNEFNNYYEKKNINIPLPEINTPIKKKDITNKITSMNYSQNCIIFPLVLPSIHSSRKENKLQKCIKKILLDNDFRKRENF